VGAVSIKICGEQRMFNCLFEHPKEYVSVGGMISEHLLTAEAPLSFAHAVLLSKIFVPNLAFNLCCLDFPAKPD
jgi:hypothetical protein